MKKILNKIGLKIEPCGTPGPWQTCFVHYLFKNIVYGLLNKNVAK